MDYINRFHGELIMLCKALGGANMESDDSGDRWLDFRRSDGVGEIWGQVRATYMGDNPVWEITVGKNARVSITDYVHRRDEK